MPMTRFGLSAGLALGRAPLLPAPLEREPAEHRRLARAGRRAAGRLVGIGRVPQPAEDVHAAHLELGGLRVLVLVDHVLVEALGHQLLGLRLHPGGHERGQVQAGVAVEHQLVVDDLVGDVGRELALGQPVPRDPVALEREERGDGQILGRPRMDSQRVLQRHVSSYEPVVVRLWQESASRNAPLELALRVEALQLLERRGELGAHRGERAGDHADRAEHALDAARVLHGVVDLVGLGSAGCRRACPRRPWPDRRPRCRACRGP